MSKEFIFGNIYFNVFILFINTSISDAFFKSFFIHPSLISIARLLLNFIFILVAIYYFLTKRIKIRKYIITILFLIFTGCTLIWTPDKFEALKLYINLIGPITYFILFFMINDKMKGIKILFNYCIMIVITDILSLTILGNVGYMGTGSEHVFRGIHLSRSTMIIYLNFCIFIFLYYYSLVKNKDYKEKYKAIIFILISLLLVLLSKSSTGVVTIALFIPLLFVMSRKRLSKIILSLSIISAILLPLMNITSEFINKLMIGMLGKTLTFSGRKYIWSYALEELTNNPIRGNGFNSTEYLLKGKVIPIYERVASHTHNGFLELFLQTGFIGLILLISIIIITYRYTFKLNKHEANLVRAYIVIFVVFNFMEPYILNSVSVITLWLPLVFIITINNRRSEEKING
ncbi:O-antigen ligase family protein [Clostridium sp.]|uniref:O-antigen ligase family protein n=1 Tax=Clostridium sp. TaxID=1506 RepID=UPI002910ED3D|nr:O-antigen ligase family protein [Clostridium sp.]MDU5107128.1 O-antigen ligase family protein [Clostridium sp.]